MRQSTKYVVTLFRGNLLYLTAKGSWTNDRREAHQFGDSTNAQRARSLWLRRYPDAAIEPATMLGYA